MKFICHLADCGDAVQVQCSSTQSEIIPLLCDNHFTVVFGLELCSVNIPKTVTNCLGPTRAFDTIGKKLFARSPLRGGRGALRENSSRCRDDIVFETGDTVLVFAEYADAAFAEEEKCTRSNIWKKSNDLDDDDDPTSDRSNDSLMPQRCFSRCLSSLRIAEIAFEDSENGTAEFLYYRDTRNQIYINMKGAVSNVIALSNNDDHSNKIIIDSSFEKEKIAFGNDPIYLCGPFHLSKPLMRFYNSLKNDGFSIHTNMPWQTADDVASVSHIIETPNDATVRSASLQLYDDFVAKEIQIFRFRTLLRSSIPSLSRISASYKQRALPMTSNISCVMTKKDLYVATVNTQIRLDVASAESNEAAIRQLTFRPLLNQYDDSLSGRCHRHFLPLHSRLLSAKALSIIAYTVLPLSTGKYKPDAEYLLATDIVTVPSLLNKHIFKIFNNEVRRSKSVTSGPTSSNANDNYSGSQLHMRPKRKKLTLISATASNETERRDKEHDADILDFEEL